MSYNDSSAGDTAVRQMRQDWNDRAREDARFFIACGQRNQSEADFTKTADDVVARIRRDIAWLPPGQPDESFRFLEIGCGIGRLMSHLAADCGEIHGVDIAEEMVRQGRARMTDVVHAHLHHAAYSDLRGFANSSFDLVYSFAVLQHLPNIELVWRYLDEAARVLRQDGVLTVQVNALATKRDHYDSWAGVLVQAEAVAEHCRGNGLRIRTLEGVQTQYAWITAQKSPGSAGRPRRLATVERIEASDGRTDVLAARDAVRLQVRFLPTTACDTTELTVRAGSVVLPVCRVSVADIQREREVDALVPAEVAAGSAQLTLHWRGTAISMPRVVTLAGPLIQGTRVVRATDGQELSRENVSSCGWVKLWLRDWFGDAADFAVSLGETNLAFNLHCDDTRLGAWQINIQLPHATPPGPVDLHVQLTRMQTVLIPILIEALVP